MKELKYMPERWCSTKEMCVYLGVSRDTLLTWINEKYIKTKFARALLGVKKVTQHNPKATCEYVPTQDFSAAYDIDWSKTISKIDAQPYAKYNLTAEEIAFIESKVKEME